MNIEDAERLANEDATTAVEMARSSGSDPICWITGNSYMPPLRAFGHAEEVWTAEELEDPDSVTLWEAYADTFEQALMAEEVSIGCPEYDNSLYVVDLQRFTIREDADNAETLQDEWESIYHD